MFWFLLVIFFFQNYFASLLDVNKFQFLTLVGAWISQEIPNVYERISPCDLFILRCQKVFLFSSQRSTFGKHLYFRLKASWVKRSKFKSRLSLEIWQEAGAESNLFPLPANLSLECQCSLPGQARTIWTNKQVIPGQAGTNKKQNKQAKLN